ncbi:hypothetical protein BDV96DRAFT_596894 [Lophiotrema nucula]|uniref:Uncharacterized protein n=1 Tax=Lophiotrema nucula TaxID=690887 RepID=A0A6A5ZHS9_9PLEO|nr:hypothetical protein BDV96DRAFT_596894 [Lophiotrema nucula]
MPKRTSIPIVIFIGIIFVKGFPQFQRGKSSVTPEAQGHARVCQMTLDLLKFMTERQFEWWRRVLCLFADVPGCRKLRLIMQQFPDPSSIAIQGLDSVASYVNVPTR